MRKTKLYEREMDDFREKKEYHWEFSRTNEKTELQIFEIGYYNNGIHATEINKANWLHLCSPGDNEFKMIPFRYSYGTVLHFMFVLIKGELIPLSLFFDRHINVFREIVPTGYDFYIKKAKGLPAFIIREQEWLNSMYKEYLNNH